MLNKNLPTIEAFDADVEWEAPLAAREHWTPVRAAKDDERTLNITDEIGDRGDGRGVTVNFVRGALRRMGSGDITVNINSPGGDFFTGLAVYNLFREHDGAINTNVIGVAASAASLIAMASDKLRVAKAGFLMIHNSHAIALGNRHDMRATASLLEQFDGAMASVYAERSGMTEKEIGKYMDAETFFKGEDAVERGLADALLASDEVVKDDDDPARAAMRTIESALQERGLTRSQRRNIMKDFKGTPSATQPATPSAGESKLLASLQAVRKTLENEETRQRS